MKKLFTLFGALLLLGGLVAPLHAQEEAEEPAAAEQEVISIPQLLKEVEYVTNVKPKKKATLYYILRSHSRCGFCRKLAPALNTHYKDMKNKGVEIIMLNCDPDTEKAKKWADEQEITIPMVTPETKGAIASKVPGGGSGNSPNIMAVMADGEQIEGCSGASACEALVAGWKDMLKDARKAESKKKAAAAKAKKKAGKKKAKKSKKSQPAGDAEL